MLSETGPAHQFAGLSSSQGMKPTESVEHGQRGRQLITIIKGTHIGIAVGLRVDGASEVILGANASIHRRQETTDSLRFLRLIVVEFQRSLFHLVVMFHSILHALLHCPRLGRGCEKQ